MSNFVYDGTPLNNTKADRTAIPFGEDPNKWVQAVADWNPAMNASLDLRGSVINNRFFGLQQLVAEPAVPTGAAPDFLWLDTLGNLWAKINGSSTNLLAGGGGGTLQQAYDAGTFPILIEQDDTRKTINWKADPSNERIFQFYDNLDNLIGFFDASGVMHANSFEIITNTLAGQVYLQRNQIAAAANVDMIRLSNGTSANVGVPQQFSPAISQLGSAWDGGASHTSTWTYGSRPVNAATVKGRFSFWHSLDSNPGPDVLTFDSTGDIYGAGDLQLWNGLSQASYLALYSGGGAVLTASANLILLAVSGVEAQSNEVDGGGNSVFGTNTSTTWSVSSLARFRTNSSVRFDFLSAGVQLIYESTGTTAGGFRYNGTAMQVSEDSGATWNDIGAFTGIALNQVAVGSGPGTLGGSTALTFDAATDGTLEGLNSGRIIFNQVSFGLVIDATASTVAICPTNNGSLAIGNIFLGVTHDVGSWLGNTNGYFQNIAQLSNVFKNGNSGSPAPALIADTTYAATDTDPTLQVANNGTVSFEIQAAGIPRWVNASNVQTTVGAAGGASALPATPAKYLKVKDNAGTTYVIPAYNP